MKYRLIRDGADKRLYCDDQLVATWDKHDPYEHCLAQAQARMGDNDELVEAEGDGGSSVESGTEHEDGDEDSNDTAAVRETTKAKA